MRITRAVDGWLVALITTLVALLVLSFVWNFPSIMVNLLCARTSLLPSFVFNSFPNPRNRLPQSR